RGDVAPATADRDLEEQERARADQHRAQSAGGGGDDEERPEAGERSRGRSEQGRLGAPELAPPVVARDLRQLGLDAPRKRLDPEAPAADLRPDEDPASDRARRHELRESRRGRRRLRVDRLAADRADPELADAGDVSRRPVARASDPALAGGVLALVAP